MALYERLLGRDDAGNPAAGKIMVHQFQACLAEFGRGVLTGAQAQAVIAAVSRGGPLTPSEVTEATTLLATVTSAGNAAARIARAKLIEDVLMLAEMGAPGYATPTQVKTRLGV